MPRRAPQNYLSLFVDSTNLGNSSLYETGGRIGFNTTAPAAPFHVAAGETPGAFFDVYSGSVSTVLGALPVVYRAARGTVASPSAVQAEDILGGMAVRGYNGATFTGGRGQVMFKAAESWTGTANGTLPCHRHRTDRDLGAGLGADADHRGRQGRHRDDGTGTEVERQRDDRKHVRRDQVP